jgi:hypothetical protein
MYKHTPYISALWRIQEEKQFQPKAIMNSRSQVKSNIYRPRKCWAEHDDTGNDVDKNRREHPVVSPDLQIYEHV